MDKIFKEFQEKYGEIKLDLACGNNKTDESYIGIDISEDTSADIKLDLQSYPWPIESNSVDKIYCSNYIEHLPHDNVKGILRNSNSFEEFKEKLLNSKDSLIDFYNEIYRVLKPKGAATLIAPYYSSIRAIGDPTHTRFIGDSTIWYLNKDWIKENKLEHYGLNCDFEVKLSYYITNEMTLKSEEVRNKAVIHDLNTVDDLIIDLIKK